VTSETARRRFTEQVLPHLDDAYSLARWLTGNPTDAEDVAQEACLRALRALEGAPVEHPRAWLLAIVRNTAFTWLAKNRPQMVVLSGGEEEVRARRDAPEEQSAPTPEDALIAKADRESVAAAIEALPLPFKETLVMREINGLSYREFADALGGRIDIVAGNPAPTLVYKRREHLISVTELRADIGDYPATPRRKTTDGYPVVVWRDGARAYAVVSDIAPAELDAFVDVFRQAAAKEQGQMRESGGGG
jgi:RNA polymerase sigma-70 factor (ECF subfamily)